MLGPKPRERSADVASGELARRIAASPTGGAAQEEAELYRRLAPRIRRFGLRRLRDAQAADDLVHEVILQTLDALRHGRVRDPDRIDSFVLGSCRMAVSNIVRGAARRERLLGLWAAPPAAGDGAAESADVDRERLDHCLHALGERERTVLVMTFYAEHTSEAISRELALSSGNVRVIRHRALSALARCLAEGHA